MFHLNKYGCHCVVVVVDKNNTMNKIINESNCNLLNDTLCLPNCNYHGDSQGQFTNAYLIINS
jgi:hypothetical protein